MTESEKRRPQSKATFPSHKVVLVLQGGGALGAYHIGAYEALKDAGFEPDWVTGISIGAINAAVIAANPPQQRLAKLEALWESISRPEGWGMMLQGVDLRMFNQFNVAEAMVLGQPNFWYPRVPSPVLAKDLPATEASFYDTRPMLATLHEHADFALLNRGEGARLSLGATRVDTGELEFFDSNHQTIDPRHVLASGSLPPGFPATEIDGICYWDGGCVSNTPLNAVLDDLATDDLLVFMVDLWSASGPLPRTMDEVAWRQKQIQYASRNAQVETLCQNHNIRQVLQQNKAGLLAETLAVARAGMLEVPQRHIDIVHITYTPSDTESSFSDAEFSRPSIQRRRDAGKADMQQALAASPWLQTHIGAAPMARLHRMQAGCMNSSLCM